MDAATKRVFNWQHGPVHQPLLQRLESDLHLQKKVSGMHKLALAAVHLHSLERCSKVCCTCINLPTYIDRPQRQTKCPWLADVPTAQSGQHAAMPAAGA